MARLVFATGSLVHGGAERHSITLANALAARGHECHAVYVKDDPSQRSRLALAEDRITCLHASSYLDRGAVGRFASLLRETRPDAILASNPYALFYATLARSLARSAAPITVTFHSNRLLNVKEHVQMAYYRACFWAAERAVFVCENQRRYWRSRGVFSRANEVVYNGVDTAAFHVGWNGAPREQMRHALGYGNRDFVVALPAVLRPEKNPVALVDAVGMLRGHGLPVRALFIGDGPLRPAVEARARELGVNAAVTVTGAQLDVRPHLAAADAVVLCSHTEALSLAALEAMALHKPVVHSLVGGAAEIVRPGWNGYLYPAGDTQALAHRIGRLARSLARESMGTNARALVEERFSEEAMVRRYEALVVPSGHAAMVGAKSPAAMLSRWTPRSPTTAPRPPAGRRASPESAATSAAKPRSSSTTASSATSPSA